MNFNFCPECGTKGSVQKQDNTNYECANCGWHFWNNAKAAVFVALVRDGKMLFCERNIEPHKGKYDLPGGFVDFNESAQAAAIRELQEELDIRIQPDQLQLLTVLHNHYEKSIVSTIDIGFIVTDWEDEPKPADDVANIVWKPFNFVHDAQFYAPAYYASLEATLIKFFEK